MSMPALFETMAFHPGEGIRRLDLHLSRLARSAATLGHRYDEDAARAALDHTTADAVEGRRIRLTLSFDGALDVDDTPLPPPIDRATVTIVPLPVASDDWRLRHKTVDRSFYDTARTATDAAEVLFTDGDGRLTEGSFTNLFVPRGEVLATPPAELGLLPGVLRADLLRSGRAVEQQLRRQDLEAGFMIGNALRGLIPATLRHGVIRGPASD